MTHAKEIATGNDIEFVHWVLYSDTEDVIRLIKKWFQLRASPTRRTLGVTQYSGEWSEYTHHIEVSISDTIKPHTMHVPRFHNHKQVIEFSIMCFVVLNKTFLERHSYASFHNKYTTQP